ncbi:J domain-containing protein 1 [Colletotrichum sidae]|uniref:J domain-containing protein 1 n=1 Tax=Colletotrichum sidae TaxID=1347389 RepID=A0A4R8TAC0_9PEZI|nr:J domain-containing protein 1 [Colletotrichum sidae]
MVLKTPPAFAICNSNVLNHILGPAHPQSITSLPCRSRAHDHRLHLRRSSRCYATIQDGSNSTPTGTSKSLAWPTCKNPTPYDIFAIPKSAPYTKARFAQLVKLYHPDTHAASPLDALPAQARLERYRLVVLANDILSCPDKRRAYDSWGAGWHPADIGKEDNRDIHDMYREADRAWRRTPGNAGMNATWEDWEQWHNRGNEKQQPLFMSNASFAALVLAALAVGTVVQTTRMDNNSAIIVEQRQIQEANISEALRRQGAAVAGKGREERIERFLRERENLNYDFTPAKLDARHGSNNK